MWQLDKVRIKISTFSHLAIHNIIQNINALKQKYYALNHRSKFSLVKYYFSCITM